MQTAVEIAREYLPDLSDEELNHVIWEYTGYPSFWHIPRDGKTPEECFRKQLKDFAEGKPKPSGCPEHPYPGSIEYCVACGKDIDEMPEPPK